eukprot:12048086-Alexandrium_andersonii.AAC.1
MLGINGIEWFRMRGSCGQRRSAKRCSSCTWHREPAADSKVLDNEVSPCGPAGAAASDWEFGSLS